MSQANPHSRPPGGLSIDYAKLPCRTSKQRRVPYELKDFIERFIDDRRESIDNRRYNTSADEKTIFYTIANQLADRWEPVAVGHSPRAWMERDVIFSAMLMDPRSRRFDKRALNDPDGFSNSVSRINASLAGLYDNFRAFDAVEQQQVVKAHIFSLEWHCYLAQLLVRPPGGPDPNSDPDSNTKRIITELFHCRPTGAFFALSDGKKSDGWIDAGGRDECRKTRVCPNCHGRETGILVERVEAGPWKESRRKGKQMVLIRLSVDTETLGLDHATQESERQQLGFYDWLRTSLPKLESFNPDIDSKIYHLERNQDMATTLTPCEVQAAKSLLQKLVNECRSHGAKGGIRFHSIGPKGRKYLHELSVVAEIPNRNLQAFCARFGVPGQDANFESHAVECIVIPRAYKSAARLLIAGSSWGFDLSKISAQLNRQAHHRTFFTANDDGSKQPRGLRGAAAWQPLFLLSSVAFWSRHRVLDACGFKSHVAFGSWHKTLTSPRQHKTAVQKRRQDLRGDGLLEGQNRDPRYMLRAKIKASTVAQAALAKRAECSPAAVSRFVNDDYGSQSLVDKLGDAVRTLPNANAGERVKPRFPNAEAAKSWLSKIGRDQSWLATKIGCDNSTVSRHFTGKTTWSHGFAEAVESVASTGVARSRAV